MNLSRLWMLIGAVGVIAILAGGYFIGVAPQLEVAQTADDGLAQTETINAGHRTELNRLRELDPNAINADVEAARATLPADHDQHQYAAQLQRLAGDAGVTLTSITYADAIATVEEAAAAAPAPTEEGAEPTAEATESPAVPAAGSSDALAIGVTLELAGTREALQGFVAALQVDPRIVAIRTVGVEGVLGSDYTLSVDGYVFVLPDA